MVYGVLKDKKGLVKKDTTKYAILNMILNMLNK